MRMRGVLFLRVEVTFVQVATQLTAILMATLWLYMRLDSSLHMMYGCHNGKCFILFPTNEYTWKKKAYVWLVTHRRERIMGRERKNNREVIQELRNRIIGRKKGIMCVSLFRAPHRDHAYIQSAHAQKNIRNLRMRWTPATDISGSSSSTGS